MKSGFIIVCRHSSSRLPGKILLELEGRTVLGHIVDRVRRGAGDAGVVVATSTEVGDDAIERWCRRSGIDCFRGPLDDVAGRFLACAERYGWDYAARINGDNVFADPATIAAMRAIAETGTFDLVTNVPGRTFPFGMSVEFVRTAFYREVIAKFEETDREHVTSWLYRNDHVGRRYTYENTRVPEATGMQLALDTAEDFARIEAIMARLPGHPADADLAAVVRASCAAPPTPWRGKYGPLMIAEIGGNHEGDFEVAMSMADQAIGTGVDCVKFQVYTGDSLVSPVESPDRNKHFKKFELTRDQHRALAERCATAGVDYLASVWDIGLLDWVDEYLPYYKIGSGDLTAWPVVREFARRGKPIILSTGLSTLDEVMQSVAFIQSVDSKYRDPEWLCLLQCTSMYPIPDHEANLRVMDSLRAATGLAVGYSDHTEGGMALRAAAAMGAQVLEFHFTDSREGKVFRDHKVSVTPAELLELQRDLAQITRLRGQDAKRPQTTEVEQQHPTSFRRAVYPARDLPAGTTLTESDLVVLRPNHGIDARDADDLIGRRLTRDVAAFQALDRQALDG